MHESNRRTQTRQRETFFSPAKSLRVFPAAAAAVALRFFFACIAFFLLLLCSWKNPHSLAHREQLYLALTHRCCNPAGARDKKAEVIFATFIHRQSCRRGRQGEPKKLLLFTTLSTCGHNSSLSSTLLHLSDGDVYCLSLPPFSSCVPFSAFGSDRLCAAGRRTLHTHAFKKATLPSFLLVIFSLSPMVTFLNLLHAL